ncbi:helix-turn-helix domain-containing protein [Halorussus pelagicus]|uniref:helix-turn-helix domain-containing protein n=1 Tax=Halorussus pelagicus TaxID=2505977 RepID=UPI00140B01A2|nr:helix-turn-helix domain-containing protein [Halorussus pelagicus]
MAHGSDRIEVYECRECGNISLDSVSSTCCDGRVVAVDGDGVVESPELPDLLRNVFGISETGLHVCLCLMEENEATAAEIAERLDIDRSTVGRQLNHLTDIGLLDKRQRLLESGGYVNVYSPVPVETVQKRLRVGLYAWVNDALDLVENVNREKIRAMARGDDGGSDDGASIYWE